LVDLWAASAASIAGCALAMRAFMLRPTQRAWIAAPAPVWIFLTALAVGLGMTAVSLWFGGHANAREGVVYSLLALASSVLLWNLNRHGRQAEVERQRISDEVDLVMGLSGQPARFWWEQRP
jgi:hypothetical protein